MSAAISDQQTPSPLLNLPPELRNQIYEQVAYSSHSVDINSGDKTPTLSASLAQVCRQSRQEFNSAYQALSLAYADNITIHNINFSPEALLLTLESLPRPAGNVNRSITIRVHLTNELQVDDITAFVTRLAESSMMPAASVGSNVQYDVSFNEELFELHSFRLVFARMAKRYRFHKCDAEQRTWEQVYWSFARAAGRVDGVSVRQYALGQWKGPGGAFCFV